MKAGQCSRCGKEQDRPGQRYCGACHAAYMRENRPAGRLLQAEAKKRYHARCHARLAVRRGQITRAACERCGDANSEMHHDDYDQPLKVRWMCRSCHDEEHRIVPGVSPGIAGASQVPHGTKT